MAIKKTMNGGAADAVALLKADHKAVGALFAQYADARGKVQKAKLARQICTELAIHTAIEEEIFYPALQGEIEDEALDEAYVEHDGAKMLMAEIMAGTPDDDFFDAKVKVLSEDIRHHVKEEEQRDGLFAQAKKAGVDLSDLGARMLARKTELKRLYAREGMPMVMTRTLSGAKVKYGQPVA